MSIAETIAAYVRGLEDRALSVRIALLDLACDVPELQKDAVGDRALIKKLREIATAAVLSQVRPEGVTRVMSSAARATESGAQSVPLGEEEGASAIRTSVKGTAALAGTRVPELRQMPARSRKQPSIAFSEMSAGGGSRNPKHATGFENGRLASRKKRSQPK